MASQVDEKCELRRSNSQFSVLVATRHFFEFRDSKKRKKWEILPDSVVTLWRTAARAPFATTRPSVPSASELQTFWRMTTPRKRSRPSLRFPSANIRVDDIIHPLGKISVDHTTNRIPMSVPAVGLTRYSKCGVPARTIAQKEYSQ